MYKSTGSPSTPKCWFPIKNPHWYGHFGSFRRFNQVGFWGLWSLMIRQFCHLRSQNDNLSYLQFQQSPGIPLFQRLFFFCFLLLWLYILIHLSCFFGICFCSLAKREAICMGCWQVLFQAFFGEGRRDLWRRVWHLEKFIPVWECFFFENWRVTHQMQPLDRFGDVQWCLTGNRIVGVKWDTLHFHMIHHTKAFFQTQSMAMNSKMPRWQWLKSCSCVAWKLQGPQMLLIMLRIQPPCFSTKVFYTSLFGMYSNFLLIRTGERCLVFIFAWNLSTTGTLSLRSENLWWFSRKPSVYIAIIYPNLHKCRTGSLIAVILAHTFCNHQAGLGEIHDFMSSVW